MTTKAKTINKETTTKAKKLNFAEFTLKAIETLPVLNYNKRKASNPKAILYKGMNTKYDGFNLAARSYFGITQDKINTMTKQLENAKVIQIRPIKGSVILYKYGEMPDRDNTTTVKDTLKAMGL